MHSLILSLATLAVIVPHVFREPFSDNIFYAMNHGRENKMTEPLQGGAEERILFLRREIERHNRLYYQEAKPEISDMEYDRLLKELELLEQQNPQFFDPNSPTQRVGGAPLKNFEQHEHRVPMMSLGNTYDGEDLRMFVRRVADRLPGIEDYSFVIEPKIDGVSISLRYENGILVRALTRGDGKVGDDVTVNIRTIKSVPLYLSCKNPPAVFEARGEVYMPNEGFRAMNAQRQAAGDEPFANPRNATAGTLKLLDSKVVAQRPLDVLFYAVGEVEGLEIDSQKQLLETLKQFGFKVPQWHKEVHGFDELWSGIEELDEKRKDFGYETDGAVIKLNQVRYREQVGSTAKAPSWAIAYKYAAETAFTRLKSITIQVGRTGILTPVAELEPVFLAGSTISRATLHNEDEIARKDIRIGDRVEIKKAGEVIPAVVCVDRSARPEGSEPFDMERYLEGKCPCCQHEIVRDPQFVSWRCNNLLCPAQNTRRVRYFATRSALDLEMLGDTVAEALVERELVKEPLDLFDLTLEQLGSLNLGTDEAPRLFGRKNAAKLLEALNTARTLPLHRWICALGIPNVGSATAFELAAVHRDFQHLIHSEILEDMASYYALVEEIRLLKKVRSVGENGQLLAEATARNEATLARLKALNLVKPAATKQEWLLAFGPKVVESVREYFASESGQQVIRRMEELNLNPLSESREEGHSSNALAGKAFVLTGTLTVMGRSEATERLRNLGAQVSGSVTRKTDFLVMGESAGAKKSEQAAALGVKVLNETEFLELLQKAEGHSDDNSAEETEKPTEESSAKESTPIQAEKRQLSLF